MQGVRCVCNRKSELLGIGTIYIIPFQGKRQGPHWATEQRLAATWDARLCIPPAWIAEVQEEKVEIKKGQPASTLYSMDC